MKLLKAEKADSLHGLARTGMLLLLTAATFMGVVPIPADAQGLANLLIPAIGTSKTLETASKNDGWALPVMGTVHAFPAERPNTTPRAIGCEEIVACLPEAGFQMADLVPRDSRSDRSSESAETVSAKLGQLVLHIPKGYIAHTMGYNVNFDQVKIWALLPCLLPENTKNLNEFYKNRLDNILIATLTLAKCAGVSGQQLLNNFATHDTKIEKINDDFLLYKITWGFDLFVSNKYNNIFIILCNMNENRPWPYYPGCTVREKIWDDYFIEYRYERKFIDNNIENSIDIDKKLISLINSFNNINRHAVNTGENGE
jgi:hypothetical protein